jgi:hypothetical protein
MCNCIARINADMKQHGVTLYVVSLAPPVAAVSLVRLDTREIERRRDKPQFVAATFCPWCGERYPGEASDG